MTASKIQVTLMLCRAQTSVVGSGRVALASAYMDGEHLASLTATERYVSESNDSNRCRHAAPRNGADADVVQRSARFTGRGVGTELTATLLLSPAGIETLATRFWSHTKSITYGAASPYAAMMVVVISAPMTCLVTQRARSGPA
jgi:hypothetical protein